MWIELIERITTECVFAPPAAPSDIVALEAQLGHALPASLKSLLSETNGVFWDYSQLDTVWSVDRIGRENQHYRQDPKLAEVYMTFDSLLFFADGGVDGILFAFPVTSKGSVRDREIFAWYPLEDSRPALAHSLEDYLTRWLGGSLTI